MDPRIHKLAGVLINYSLKLKKGKLVKIQGEVVTLPLMNALYEEALNKGAYPFLQVIVPETQEIFLKNASKEQMKYISPVVRTEVNKIDNLIAIWGAQNTRNLSGIDSKRQAMFQQGRSSLVKTLRRRMGDGSLNWVGTMFPTHADAQQAEMSLSDYEEFVYRAGHLHLPDPVKHWKKVHAEQQRLIKILNRVDKVRIRAEGTDLRLRVKGRKWVNCSGGQNFPDGEIFTGPIEDTAEGHIHYKFPSTYGGRTVEGIRLEFKKGKVVKESATKDQDYLTAMLNIDKGARFLGEFAFGTNYQIKRATGNTLFDEKIGGTCHLAVGTGFPESGSKNTSTLHWDMVCDLKKGGEVEADGKVIYRNGKFKI